MNVQSSNLHLERHVASLLHAIKGLQDATSSVTTGEGGPNCSLIHKPQDIEFGVVFLTEISASILNIKATLDFRQAG